MNLTISASAKVFWHVPQVRISWAVGSASPVSESAVNKKKEKFLLVKLIKKNLGYNLELLQMPKFLTN